MTNFGYDISCVDGIRTGRFVSGTRLVAEACYRRLTTPRGSLRGAEDENNYGIDLTELCGEMRPELVILSLPAKIKNELLKDERVADVSVDLVTTGKGLDTVYHVTIAVETEDGPFTFNVSADNATSQLVGFTDGS